MKAKTKLIIGIVLAVVILAVGLTVTLVVTGNLERDQQQVVRSASQIETAMSTDLGGKTIVLAEDITVEGDLEMSRLADLDLNGHTLTVTGAFSVESDSKAEIEIKSTDGDKAVSGGTIDAGSVDINVPNAHVEWSGDVRLGSNGTFTVLTSGDSFIFTGRFLTSGSNTGTTAAGDAAITALGGRVEIASQTANVEYKVNIPSTASDVRVDSGVPSTSSVEVITSKSVTVSGTVAVTVSEGASGVAITADSGSSLTVTGSAASVNAPSSSVTVAENSTVGSITAGDVTNNGTVSGSITATGDVVNNGSVAGDVTAGGSVTGDGDIGGNVEAGDVTVVEIPTLTSSATYSGAAQTFTVAATDYYDAVTVTGTDADTYTGTLSLSDKVNTKWSDGTTDDKTVTLTIAPKSVAVVWSNMSLTYNGSAQAPTATVDTGITGETLTLTVAGQQTNAGTYTATASTTNGNYTLTNATTSFTIAKATYDMSDISFTDLTVPYDEAAHTLTISGTLPSGVSVSYTTNSYTDVGTYTVTASFTGDSQNYNAIPNKTATLTITSSTATATTAEQLKSYVANANYGTVILGADIAADVEIAENRTIILDLNGHTLTNVSAHTIYNNGTLTVIDSSEAKTGVVDNITHAKAALYNEVGATATLNGGEFTRSKENGSSSTESGGNSYYAILNHGTMTINAGTKVTQNGHYSSLLENGWYDGSENTDETASVLTINGGEFTGGLNTIKNDDWGVLTINDGEFSNMTQSVVLNWNVAEINGGTFTVSEDAEQFAFILNGYINDTMDRGVLTVSADVTFNGSASIFAQMDGSKNAGTITVNSEEHLNAALEVSSVTIILGTDMTVNAVIEKGVTVTLDLNGHTLTSDVTGKATVHNYGDVTIVGNGLITRGTNTKWYVIVNEGTMTLDGDFTVKNDNTSDSSSVIINNYDCDSAAPAQLTINDGTYYSASSNAVKNDEYGVLTIDGGTFETSIATHVAVQNWATMTINGGEFTGPGQAVSVMAYEGQTNTTTITGGMFGTPTSVYLRNGYVELPNYNCAKGTINLTITGGTFNGILTTHASDTLLATDKIDLSGFDGEVVIYANSESSLKAAVAIDNASVELSGDITLTEVLNIDNTVVLNLNDHTIKVEIPNVSVENGAVAIRANEGGNLTINGNGTIDARPPEGEEYANNDYLVAVGAMRNGGYITINEGVTIIVDTPRESCVYVMNGGIVTINGGTFINECTDDYAYGGGAPLTLNVSNSAQVTDIVVYGGTFRGRNPALGDDKLGGNFVADGYKVVERTDGTYEVVAEEAEVTGDDIAAIYYYNNGVASKAEVYAASGLTNAIGGGYSDIVLMNDITTADRLTISSAESDVDLTIDLGGYTLTSTESGGYVFLILGCDTSNAYTPYKYSIDLTIKNGEIITSIDQSYAVDIRSKSDNVKVSLSDLKMTAVWGGMYSNGIGSGAVVTAANCEFIGTGDASVGAYLPANNTYTFTDCSFSGDDGIYIKSGTYTFNNCTFAASGEYAEPEYNGNGAPSVGAAMAIDSCQGYQNPIVVTVNGGTFSSVNGYGIMEYITERTEGMEPYATVTLKGDITFGECGKGEIYSQNNLITVTDGSSNANLSDFVTESGKVMRLETDKWVVYDGASVWDGTSTDTSWYNENDTEFTIDTAAELAGLAKLVNEGNNFANKTVVLNADIDLAGHAWTPIGSGVAGADGITSGGFLGTFDGNNHVIIRLTTVSDESEAAAAGGLFAVVGGTVENLILEQAAVTTNKGEGIAAAVSVLYNGTVSNVITAGGSVSGNKGVGGVVGRLYSGGVITGCENYASVAATTSGGGIVGQAYYSREDLTINISACINYGDVTSDYAAGGITSLTPGNITQCYNFGDITAATVAGGIVAENNMGGSVDSSINYGNVTGGIAGGIVGWSRYTESTTNYQVVSIIKITDNSNYGYISSNGTDLNAAGGIIGTAYNAAYVSGNTNRAAKIGAEGNNFVAGIIGNVQNVESNNAYNQNGWDSSFASDDVRLINNTDYSTERVGSLTDEIAYINTASIVRVWQNNMGIVDGELVNVYYGGDTDFDNTGSVIDADAA